MANHRKWSPVPNRLLEDEDYLALPFATAGLLDRLYRIADRVGRFPAGRRALCSLVGSVDAPEVFQLLGDLEAAGLVRRYHVDGKDVGEIRGYLGDLSDGRLFKPRSPSLLGACPGQTRHQLASYCTVTGDQLASLCEGTGEFAETRIDGGPEQTGDKLASYSPQTRHVEDRIGEDRIRESLAREAGALSPSSTFSEPNPADNNPIFAGSGGTPSPEAQFGALAAVVRSWCRARAKAVSERPDRHRTMTADMVYAGAWRQLNKLREDWGGVHFAAGLEAHVAQGAGLSQDKHSASLGYARQAMLTAHEQAAKKAAAEPQVIHLRPPTPVVEMTEAQRLAMETADVAAALAAMPELEAALAHAPSIPDDHEGLARARKLYAAQAYRMRRDPGYRSDDAIEGLGDLRRRWEEAGKAILLVPRDPRFVQVSERFGGE